MNDDELWTDDDVKTIAGVYKCLDCGYQGYGRMEIETDAAFGWYADDPCAVCGSPDTEWRPRYGSS